MTRKGRTSLHYAIHRGRQGIVGLLLYYGANPLLPTASSISCLQIAKSSKHEEEKQAIIELLEEAIRNTGISCCRLACVLFIRVLLF